MSEEQTTTETTSAIATARATLNALADLVVARVTPFGRATATAATLRQIGDLACDLPLTLADAAAGFQRLSFARGEAEPGNVEGRRATCRELAALALSSLPEAQPTESGPVAMEVPAPRRLAAVFRAVAAELGASTDPRQAAIAATAQREAAELER
jgi:hypothetical protein